MPEPERTCVGCRRKAPKDELLRFVATDGSVRMDRTGIAPGRGAYVHADLECGREAVRRGGLARAVRASFSPDEVSNLLRTIEEAITTT